MDNRVDLVPCIGKIQLDREHRTYSGLDRNGGGYRFCNVSEHDSPEKVKSEENRTTD